MSKKGYKQLFFPEMITFSLLKQKGREAAFPWQLPSPFQNEMAAGVNGKVEFSFLDYRHFQHFPILPTAKDANCVCTEAMWQWSVSSSKTHTYTHTF